MTSARRSALACATLLILFTGAANARPKKTPELDKERDQLIEQLVKGEDFEAAVKRYKDLVARRDKLVPTSETAQREYREALDLKNSWYAEWRKTADAEVAWRCALSVDPKNAQQTDRWDGDWGPVIRKEEVQLPPKNALDEGEVWTVYEVQGQHRNYKFRGHRFGISREQDFEAKVGDLVLVCDGGRTTESKLPESWQKDFQRSGFAVRLQRPPKITQKGKWNPIHTTDNKFYWAVKDVKWRFPEGAPVLSVIDVKEDLGGGRWLIDTIQDITYIVEVPPGLPRRELMVPGTAVWAIMSSPRFDKTLRALVMKVEDLEARYIDEVPSAE